MIINPYAFGVVAVTPTQQAYLWNVGTRETTSEVINWSRGNGAFVIVLAKSAAAVNSNPVDGSSYSANSIFGSGTQLGSGNYVVYIGTGVTVTVTGLTAGTQYHYRVMEFNGTKYLTRDEQGHLWASQTAPAAGMIGTCKSADDSILVRTGSGDIYYSTDFGESWTLWANVAGAQFHSCVCAEGGTIHNAAGTPVTRKFFFFDHGGSAKIYAGYTPGDVPETVITGASSQTWNEGAWNSSTSNLCSVSDHTGSTNKIAILANGRTVAYQNSPDASLLSSVCATPGAGDGTEFVATAKNAASSGFNAFKRVAGVWLIKATPLSRNYHMVRYVPTLGVSGRVCMVSADDTANASLYSDDFFETYTQGNLDGSGHTTGGYGSFAYDATLGIGITPSRHVNEPIGFTYDFITWSYITNPGTTSVWFNVMNINGGFVIQASGGAMLGAKTTPSNIGNASTRLAMYTDWEANLNAGGIGLPTGNYIRDFTYMLGDNPSILAKCGMAWFANTQTDKNAVKKNVINPATFTLIEVGTVTFASGTVVSASSSYFRTTVIPSIDLQLNSLSIAHRVQSNVDGTLWDYGVTGSGGATQRIFFNSRTGNIISVALNSATANCTGSQTDSTCRALNTRDGATTADHDVDKNGVEWDGSNAASASRPDREIYWLAHNNNGTAGFFSTRTQGYLIIFTTALTNAEAAIVDAFLATIP